MPRAEIGVIKVAAVHEWHRLVEAAIDDDDLLRRMRGEANRFIDQMLVGNRLAAAHSAVGGDHDFRLRIVDARGKARGSETAEHNGMNGADPHAREHCERSFGDHRHVDKHAVAAAHALAFQRGREAVHLGVELRVGITPVLARFRRDVDQRLLGASCREMPVDRVVAEVRAPADEPSRKRRLRVVEHGSERRLPIDGGRLGAPERVAVGNRTVMELLVGGHSLPRARLSSRSCSQRKTSDRAPPCAGSSDSYAPGRRDKGQRPTSRLASTFERIGRHSSSARRSPYAAMVASSLASLTLR